MISADAFDGDPHEELGVEVDASLPDIKRAYRRLAAKWHPDRNTDPQAVRRMQRINQAYQRLCEWLESEDPPDPDAPEPPPEPPPEPATATATEPPPRAKRAWWERNWGFARWEPDGQVAPQPIQVQAQIDLESAAFGCVHHLKGFITDLCADCAGVGRWIAPRSSCSVCAGEGRVPGPRSGQWTRCQYCHGDGVDRKPCEQCQGSGRMASPREYHFEVRIPPGLPDGQMILLRGQGQRCGEEVSDIELTVRIRPHPLFRWNDAGELCCDVPVDLFTVLGEGTVEVPTLDGHLAKVSMADGPDQVLPSMGFPRRDGTPGPLHVSIRTLTPGRVNAAQKALLKQLAEAVQADEASCPELADWQRQLKARASVRSR
ncbi:MAG: DnaJ C-terminal domain-containing protein [Acidobacteriota bacterium]